MATLLRSDWQRAVEDELSKHAQGLQQTAQNAVQVVQGVRAPDPNDVLQQLQGHAQGLLQQPAPAPVQQAQQGIIQLGQNAEDVSAQLQQHAQSLFPAAPPQPEPPPPTQTIPLGQAEQPMTAPTTSITEPGREAPRGELQDYARQAAQKAGIDPEVFVRQIQQESGFNPRARSPAGATGVAQIMPETAKGWGVDPNDPYASLDAAARNMAVYIDKYGGWEPALRAYNAGPGRIEQSKQFDETNKYVGIILGGQPPPTTPARHEPSTPQQTPGTQIANAPDVDGRVFPLASAPSNKPNQTYHSEGGSDLMAPTGTPVLNMRGGTVTSVYTDNGEHQAGGNAVMIRGDDGLDYYYAHFDQPPGLERGQRVETGVQIGAVGNSGNAWKGGKGDPHLHIGIGKGISNGVGSEGGLGQGFNAQELLGRLLPGIGQATTTGTARTAAQAARPDEPWSITNVDPERRSTQQPLYVQQQQPAIQTVQGTIQDTAQRVGGFFNDVGTGVQQGLSDLNRTDLGNLVMRSGRTQEEMPAYRERQQSELRRVLEQQQEHPLTALASSGLGGAFQALIQNPPSTGIQLDDYMRIEGDKNTWIEQNNPIRDVPVAGGLTTMVAQQITSPLVLATFQPTNAFGIRAGAAVTEALAPNAARWVANAAGKLTSGAISNGLQNAIFEATQPGASPDKVGMALLVGAGLGGGLEAGAPAVKAAVRYIGREVSDAVRNQATRDAMEAFARSEVGELNLEGTGGASQAADELAASRAARVPEVPRVAPVEPVTTPPAPVEGAPPLDVPQPEAAVAPPAPEPAGFRAPEAEPVVRTAVEPEPAGRRFHYTIGGDFDQFRTGTRGAVYLAETPMDALRGAQAGYRENVRRSAGIPERLREEQGRLLRVDVTPETRVFQDQWPERMTAAEHDSALDRFDQLKEGASPDVARALDTLRNRSVGRAGALEAGEIVYREAPRALSHTEAETPAMQEALRRLGADAVQVDDEAGRSLAVLDPQRLNIAGRAPAQAQVPFALDVGGAAFGGYAGNVATPEDASPEERLRNIGIGAGVGLLGGRLASRGMGPPREPAFARAGAPEGFRAPGGPPEPVRGADVLQARTQEPRAGGPEPQEPRSLGEVHSNPHLLREAGPEATPMSVDERITYQDELQTRLEDVQSRAAAIDEVLRNPLQKPYRPPWAAGYTNDALIEIARRNGANAYEEAWDQKIGLDPGSAEVKYDVGESGLRGTGKTEPTPTEYRAELRALQQEERDLLAAGDQLANAPDDARLVRRPVSGEAVARGELPFDDPSTQEGAPSGPFATEVAGPSGNLAEDLVTKNGTVKPSDPLGPKPGLTEDAAGILGRGEVKGRDVTGRGITDPTQVPEPGARARAVMPNLDAMLGDNMPEVRAQIEQAVNDNVELFEAYQQGRISHDSLVHDLATKVGMSKADFLKTPVGKGFSTAETVALQAAAIESQVQQRALAASIEAKGGVDALTPEEVAWGLSSLLDAARLTAVASGARSTAGRTLNALKIRIDATMSRAISASNEVISATRIKDQARRGEARAKKLLEQAKELDAERSTVAKAAAAATEAGDPSTAAGGRGKANVWQQIEDAYNDLDRYQAMTLHEKADDFDRLAKERAERAAARKEHMHGAPDELLSALKAELKAERDIFAGRKDTWETMAFWDSKADAIAAQKRADFRGGLYLEQQRRSAAEALKKADDDYARAWKAESARQTRQTERASMLLERIGGIEPTKELLDQFVKAINSGDDLGAAKFLKGMQDPGWWGKATILRLAGLLSSTATHMANATGNITQPLITIPVHALTVGIDWARAARTGGERQAYWAELGPMIEAYGPGVLASWNDFRTVLRTGIAPSDLTDLSRLRAGFHSGSEAVDTVVEAPLRLLSASDVLFRGGAFAMHANRVATRFAVGEGFEGAARKNRALDIVSHLEEYPELYQQAYDAASRMVFQEKRTMPMPGGFTKGMPGAIQRGAVSQVLPFIKTPANITAQGFGMTPLGFLGVGEAVLNRPNVPAARMGQQTLLAEERAARATVGTLIFGGFMALGAGTLTGGKSMLTAGYPQDAGEASTLPPGWREWSVRVEDGVTGNVHYVPFQNFGAAGVPMAMAALLTDSGKRNRGLLDKDEMTRAVTGIGAYVLDNTFMQGMSDAVNVLHDPERYAPKFVEGLVSSYGPYSAMGRQVQRAMGVAARNPREGFQGLVDALISNYPGTSGLVPEATTALGDERSMGVSGIGAVISPVRSSLEVDEPTLRVLRENDVSVAPASKSISIGRGQEIELTEPEQDRLKRARGAAIKRNVAAAQQTQGWKSATSPEARNAILRHAMQAAQESSKLEFFRTLSTAEVEQRRKAARELEPTYIGGAA